MKVVDVIVVAQIPPPIHGQAVMVERLLQGQYEKVRLHHVRMSFSKNIDEVGRFSFRKLWHVFDVILKTFVARIRTGASVLYYPPAGPKKNAFYRDTMILIATRWLFRKTVFHFYAAGISELYNKLSWWERWIYRKIYFGADLGIALFRDGLADPEFFECEKSVVAACGSPDLSPEELGLCAPRDHPLVVTFLAMLSEEKGVLLFLDACATLLKQGVELKPVLVGWSRSAEFENRLQQKIKDIGLTDALERHDRTVGSDKYAIYRRTSVFCFPTFYPSEGSPVVLLEAMQFGIPVLTTDWRGCSDCVVDAQTGYIVPPKNLTALVEKLGVLLEDADLRKRMSECARARYEEMFTVKVFQSRLEELLGAL